MLRSVSCALSPLVAPQTFHQVTLGGIEEVMESHPYGLEVSRRREPSTRSESLLVRTKIPMHIKLRSLTCRTVCILLLSLTLLWY